MPDNARPVLILTRPALAAARFRAQAAGLLADVDLVEAPVLEIVALPVAALPRPARDYAAVIFTSENGAAQAGRLGLPRDIPAWCVGGQTARAAQAAGFATRTAGGDADSLVALMQAEGAKGPVLHIRGAHARGAVAGRLGAAGIVTDECVAYDQRALPLPDAVAQAVRGPQPVVLTLYSPRSAALLRAALPDPARPVHLAAISAAACAPFADWQAAGLVASCHISPAPLGPDMLAAVAAAVRAAQLGVTSTQPFGAQ